VTPRTRTLIGLLLAVPALIVLIWSYAWPTGWTVWASFHRLDPLSGTTAGSGTRNYSAMSDGFGAALGFALRLGLLPLLAVVVVAPLLAFAAHRAGTGSRWVTRGVLAIPLACYTPTGLAVAWSVQHRTGISDPASAGSVVAIALGLSTLGLVVAVGATLFLAALRRREPARAPWPAFVVVGVVAVLTVLAVSLQQFAFPYAMTGGGPERSTETPALLIYEAFQRYEWGPAAAVSTVLLLLLAVLGMAATLALALSGARLEYDAAHRSAEQTLTWTPARIVALAATAAGLVVVLVLIIVGLYPWLHGLATAHSHLPNGTGTGAVLVNTWLPTLVSTLVAVLVALLAGFGIGWLRPLGRRSLLLLLVFGPWLFTGNGVLTVHAYFADRDSHDLDSFTSLIPPFPVVPALFVFTLLFFGLRETAGARWWSELFIAVPPMVLLVFGATWVVQAQDLFWQLLAAVSPTRATAAVALLTERGRYVAQADQLPYDVLTPVLLIVVMLLSALGLQLGYLDRLAFRVGRPRREGRQE
jgi:ABC-type sugar transport system permease subunit